MGQTSTHKAVSHNGVDVNSQSCLTQWGRRQLTKLTQWGRRQFTKLCHTMGQTSTHKAVSHNGVDVNSQSCLTQWGRRQLTKLSHTIGQTSAHNAGSHNGADVNSQRCLILRSYFLGLTRMLRDGFRSNNNNDLNAPCHTASTFQVSVVNNGDDGKAVLLCDNQSPTPAFFSSLAVSRGN